MMAGAQLAQGILALLVRRGVTGQGGRVDVSLIETAIDLQFEHLAVYINRVGAMPVRSAVANANRPEERRDGKEGVSSCCFPWWPHPENNNKQYVKLNLQSKDNHTNA